MANPLFSTYSQGENRVTSTLVAVLGHVNGRLVEELVGAMLGDPEFELLTLQNQVTGEGSVPDALVAGTGEVYVETKTARGAVDTDQLREHLAYLSDDDAHLLVLTPDDTRPSAVETVADERVRWSNFDTLVEAVETVLDRTNADTETTGAIATEREAFLLRELVSFVYEADLTSGRDDRVAVVAAGRHGWDEFQRYGCYIHQPDRSFRPSRYLAFYVDGEVKSTVPEVTERVNRIRFTRLGVENANGLTERQRRHLLGVLDEMEEHDSERLGDEHGVFFLDEDTGIRLDGPVENDKTARESDTRVAFTYSQRYVSADRLRRNPAYTSALEDD
ncbi:hypothetical protein [Halomarina rubra]|uniref:PD-(D/E)XK nuclease superfamily protein n=1 Tax=Halomarina rubra TaxID=2071873 RepID=A0ABD6B0W6_9EURY|nr:hypothetical protein [Halomarina rubra]